MKVELESGVWLSEGEGDPPRTIVEADAKDFPTMEEAQLALSGARQYRSFPNAIISENFF